MKNEGRTTDNEHRRRGPWAWWQDGQTTRRASRLSFFILGCSVFIPVFALVLPAAAEVSAAPPAEAKALLDRAIAAAGGAEALAKLRCCRLEQEGKVKTDKEIRFASVTWTAPGDRLKIANTLYEKLGAAEKPHRFLQALDGKEGWTQAPGEGAAPAPPDAVANLREQLHYARIERLIDLRDDPGFTLTRLRPGRIDGQAAERLEVAHAGQPTFLLSFSDRTGLLLKMEGKVKDGNTGRFVLQEVFYADYRPVGALLYPHEQIVYQDGNKTQEARVVKLELLERLDAAEFARP